MLQATETSSKTWLPVPPKLMLLSSWSPLLRESSRLEFPLKDKPKSTPSWPSLLESETSLSVSTRWTRPQLNHTTKSDSTKSKLKPQTSLRNSDTKKTICNSFQFQDTWVKILSLNQNACLGIRVFVLLTLLIVFQPLLDQTTSHLDFHFKMFTRSLELVPSQLEELKLESSSQVWMLPSPQVTIRLMLSLLNNITLKLKLLIQVITLVSTSRVYLLRIFKEDVLPQTPRMIQPRLVKVSLLRSSSWSIQDKSAMDTHQFLIVILLTLLASSRRFFNLLTREPENQPKKSQPQLKLETLLWLTLFQLNRWLLRPSFNIHLLEDSPSEIWNKPSVLVLSSQLSRNNKLLFYSFFLDFIFYFY